MNWPDLHEIWKQRCEECGTDHSAGIEPLPLQRSTPYSHRGNVDWWPKSQLKERLNPPPRSVWSSSMAGTIHTAELIWSSRGDVQRQQAILIAASLWDKKNGVPDHWRGSAFDLLRGTFYTLTAELKIDRWYHSCREALPWSLNPVHLTTPHSVDDLLGIAAIEYAVIKANWQVVKFGVEADDVESRTPTAKPALRLLPSNSVPVED